MVDPLGTAGLGAAKRPRPIRPPTFASVPRPGAVFEGARPGAWRAVAVSGPVAPVVRAGSVLAEPALGREERRQHRGALLRQHAAHYPGPVVEPRVGRDGVERVARPRLR